MPPSKSNAFLWYTLRVVVAYFLSFHIHACFLRCLSHDALLSSRVRSATYGRCVECTKSVWRAILLFCEGTRKMLVHVKEQECWRPLVGYDSSPFCDIDYMVWCETSLFFQSLCNPFLCMLSWWYFMCFSCCVIYLLPLLFPVRNRSD